MGKPGKRTIANTAIANTTIANTTIANTTIANTAIANTTIAKVILITTNGKIKNGWTAGIRYKIYMRFKLVHRFQEKLRRSSYVCSVVEARDDMASVWGVAKVRVQIGFVLLILGWVTGWPLVAVLGALAAVYARSDLITVVAPIAYGISWIPYLAGFGLLGTQGYKYRKSIGRSFVRFFACRIVPEWRDGVKKD